MAIIALIIYPTIGKVLANNKTKAYEKQIDIVKKAAANWLTTNGYQGWNTITFTACNETACDTSSVDYYVRNKPKIKIKIIYT